MKLHCDVFGHGPDLVFLHGWGMHSELWMAVARNLSDRFRVTLIDLPGHGASPRYDQRMSLTELGDIVAESLPGHCSLIGWSLGGLVAQQLALQHPGQVRHITLVASSACFTRRDDWPHAMTSQVLADFHHQLEQDPATTLQRFLALQVFGIPDQRHLLRTIQQQLHLRTLASHRALLDGFAILLDSDLREQFSHLSCPVSILLGSHDRIVPPATAEAMQDLLPGSSSYIFHHAGHLPFLSHQQEFICAIRNQPRA